MLHSEGNHVFPQANFADIIKAGPNAVCRNLGERSRRNHFWGLFYRMCQFIKSRNDEGELATGAQIEEHMGWSVPTRHNYVREGKINKYLITHMGPFGGVEVVQMPLPVSPK